MKKAQITLNFTALILLFGWLPCVVAQSGGFAGAYSRMGFSPRGMAMGNAMTAVHQEGSYSFYNPALAAAPSATIMADLSTAALRFDRKLHMFTSHFQLPPSAGFSVSLMNARVSDIDGRTQSGYHTDMLSTNEFQLLGNFGLRFSDAVWGGIGIKYNLANLHPDVPGNGSIGLDAGIRIQVAEKWGVALAVKDLISAYTFDTSDLYGNDAAASEFSFPTRILAGVAADITERWLMSADFETRLQSSEKIRMEENRVVREEVSSQSRYLRVGTRYLLHERVTLRSGLQFHDIGNGNEVLPSAGFSIHLPYDRFSPSIDYAFMQEPSQLSSMHVFAIRLNI